MRLIVESLIIAAVLYIGWNKPFKDQFAWANATIESKLHSLRSNLQKHEDPSARRH